MPFSVVDARAPLAAAASADVERGAKASSSAAKLSAARADVLLLSVIGADDESPAIAAVMIDAEKTAAHAVAAAGSSHMGVLGTSVADSGQRMAVANKVPAGPASKKLSTTLPELVLITGGTSGFGFGAAEIYARRGCDVIITSRSLAAATAAAEQLAAAAGGGGGASAAAAAARARINPWRWTWPTCAASSPLSTRTRPPSGPRGALRSSFLTPAS